MNFEILVDYPVDEIGTIGKITLSGDALSVRSGAFRVNTLEARVGGSRPLEVLRVLAVQAAV